MARRAPDVERIYAPGELEHTRRDGIPLNAVTLADLRRIAAEYGVSTDVVR